MKRIVLIGLLVLVLALVVAVPAFAQEDHCASGRAFGQHHAEMAQMGMLGKDMNPGMHQGYSTCLP